MDLSTMHPLIADVLRDHLAIFGGTAPMLCPECQQPLTTHDDRAVGFHIERRDGYSCLARARERAE